MNVRKQLAGHISTVSGLMALLFVAAGELLARGVWPSAAVEFGRAAFGDAGSTDSIGAVGPAGSFLIDEHRLTMAAFLAGMLMGGLGAVAGFVSWRRGDHGHLAAFGVVSSLLAFTWVLKVVVYGV